MSTKKILSFVACFSVIITPNLFGMNKDSLREEALRSLFDGTNSLRDTKQGRNLKTIELLGEAATRLKAKKDALDPASKDPAVITKREAYEKLLINLGNIETAFLTNISNDGWDRTLGIFFAKLFAGTNSIDEGEISGFLSGLSQGLVVPAGEVMKGRAKTTIDQTFGSLWDFLFAKLSDFGSLVRNILFHNNNEPFDYQKLDGWQKMIMAAYDDIDNMLRNGLRDSTRSLDSVSRQFDDNGTEVQVKKEIDMWSSLASGYAEQFAYFITLFEKRREYYDEDDIVVFYSNQICQMLQTTCKLLTNSKSLKDLDTKLESQRTIIPAIKKNLWNLFEQLKAEVKPKSYSMKDTGASTASTYKPSSYNAYSGSNQYGYNNDGPTSFAGGF